MADRVLPSREMAERARVDGYAGLVVWKLIRAYVSGRLVDREAIDYDKAAIVIEQNNDLDRRIGTLTLHDFRMAVDAAIGDTDE